MHPALSLAKRKLADARAEFDAVMAIEADIVPAVARTMSPVAVAAKNALRASGIEGMYTGIEGVLKEILAVVDGGVFASESWHAHLLAQAAAPNERKGRPAIISDRVYERLDRLRAFRHIERNIYRHLLRESDVDENLARLTEVFPLFEAEIGQFFKSFDQGNPDDAKGTQAPSGSK